MKIAILSFGHYASSLPLAKRLAAKSIFVDYYIHAHNFRVRDVEGTDCKSNNLFFLTGQIPLDNAPKLSNYLNGTDSYLKVCYFNVLSAFSKMPLIKHLVSYFRELQTKIICSKLNALKYDAVLLVGRHTGCDDIKYFCKYLNSKVYVGLHEVVNHVSPCFDKPSRLLRYLFDSKIPIIVYSQKSYDDLCKYQLCHKSLVKLIHFGLFESYKMFSNESTLLLPDKYLLCYGFITSYKGIPLLIDAVKSNPSILQEYKIVIAGSGYDHSLDMIANDERFIVINKYLSNSEIAQLISNSKAVLCPYLSMSQSGIPQTTFTFGKPIIAADLQGFREVIINNKNSLLFATGDAVDLALAIDKIISDPIFYQSLQEGACSFEQLFPTYSWNYITDKYISLFCNS